MRELITILLLLIIIMQIHIIKRVNCIDHNALHNNCVHSKNHTYQLNNNNNKKGAGEGTKDNFNTGDRIHRIYN